MKLRDLLASLGDVRVVGDPDREVADVRDDSRLVGPGDLFVAVPGTVADGRKFVADAVGRGAVGVLMEAPAADATSAVDSPPSVAHPDFTGTVVTVPDARHAVAVIAANRFGAARALTLTAVTGTNGKTTTTYLLESMLAAAGIRAGVMGTIAYRLGPAGPGTGEGQQPALSFPAPLTTPGALALHRVFADMRNAGATDVVLEASSHALDQRRLDGCTFAVAGLTNLTQDHLDYHQTMERYLDAKSILFERLLDPQRGTAVLPIDLPEGRALRARARGGATLMVAATVGARGADIAVEQVRMSAAGLSARVATPSGRLDIVSPLVGDYNLANIVLAVGMAYARGVGLPAIAAGLEQLSGVPGRLERVGNDRGVLCLVDYAHTPDALERALAVVRPLVAPGGRLVTVFGCGGDRDRTKRPLMGQAVARGSDLAIVTSDNPRGEQPDAIISMIVAGMTPLGFPALAADGWQASGASRGFIVEADRRAAIRRGVAACRAGDVLLIAGKGHEDYQLVGASRLPFDDRDEARAAFTSPPFDPAGLDAPTEAGATVQLGGARGRARGGVGHE